VDRGTYLEIETDAASHVTIAPKDSGSSVRGKLFDFYNCSKGRYELGKEKEAETCTTN
jgi:hypothetical protein